jgi:hypothetical protein
MVFDPDAYLAEKAPPAAAGGNPIPVSASPGAAPAFDPDAYLKDQGIRAFTGPEAFGIEAQNLFGAGPLIHGVISKLGGGDFSAARADRQADLEALENDEEHPWARRAGKLAALGAETLAGGAVGKVVSAGAKAAGIAAKLAPWAEANPVMARVLEGIGGGAAYGAASGAGEAASKGEDILPSAARGAAAGGALGGVVGGAFGALGKALKGAPERESEDLLRGVSHGTGESGSATVTARKLVDRDKQDILATLRSDPELTKAVQGPAKEALPVLQNRLEEVGSKLDPRYDIVDKVTGGVSVQNLVNVLNDEIATLRKTPLNEQYIKAVEDIRDSALRAWAPEMSEHVAANERLTAMGLTPRAEVPDVMVPTRDVRAMVTRLQTRGSQVINPLNPGEAAQMKADMAGMMKGFIDSHLDLAAEHSPEAKMAVDGIRALNDTYSALKNMYKAVEQRGWKEQTGSKSLGGHLASLFHGGGTAGALLMAAHGNIPGAAASLVAGHVVPKLPVAVRAGNSLLAQIQRGVEAGSPKAIALMKAIQAARTVGTAGAGAVGAAASGTLAEQEATP